MSSLHSAFDKERLAMEEMLESVRTQVLRPLLANTCGALLFVRRL